jgi:hypothetical protein
MVSVSIYLDNLNVASASSLFIANSYTLPTGLVDLVAKLVMDTSVITNIAVFSLFNNLCYLHNMPSSITYIANITGPPYNSIVPTANKNVRLTPLLVL